MLLSIGIDWAESARAQGARAINQFTSIIGDWIDPSEPSAPSATKPINTVLQLPLTKGFSSAVFMQRHDAGPGRSKLKLCKWNVAVRIRSPLVQIIAIKATHTQASM